MGMKAKIKIKESVESLNLLYKKERNSIAKLKLKCLLYTKENKYSTQSILATHLGISHATVKRWIKIYREEGLLSYLSEKRGGNRKNILPEEVHIALSKRVNSSSDPFKGYWDVQLWIKKHYNIDIKYTTIRSYLIRHFKTKLKTPRKSHYKKDQQAIEAFFKTS